MTNAEKYLKDGTDLCELIRKIADYKPKLETSDNVYAKMQEFFCEPATPTLTEDERVILRNISSHKCDKIRRKKRTIYNTLLDRLPRRSKVFI